MGALFSDNETRKTDEAEIAPDSYMSVHMMIQTQVLLS